MSHAWMDAFAWNDPIQLGGEELTANEKYKRLVVWAGKARGKNPLAFDELTGWILDDAEWGEQQLADNEQVLMQPEFPSNYTKAGGSTPSC